MNDIEREFLKQFREISNQWYSFHVDSKRVGEAIQLDGDFTADQLRQIAALIQRYQLKMHINPIDKSQIEGRGTVLIVEIPELKSYDDLDLLLGATINAFGCKWQVRAFEYGRKMGPRPGDRYGLVVRQLQ